MNEGINQLTAFFLLVAVFLAPAGKAVCTGKTDIAQEYRQLMVQAQEFVSEQANRLIQAVRSHVAEDPSIEVKTSSFRTSTFTRNAAKITSKHPIESERDETNQHPFHP